MQNYNMTALKALRKFKFDYYMQDTVGYLCTSALLPFQVFRVDQIQETLPPPRSPSVEHRPSEQWHLQSGDMCGFPE